MKKGLDEIIASMTEGEEAVESVKEITYTDELNEFTIKCDASLYSEMDSLYAASFMIAGAAYKMFNGVDSESAYVIVNFVDAETGDVIETVDSRDEE
jgi:hypothetical protein